jgi:hypothetical protein
VIHPEHKRSAAAVAATLPFNTFARAFGCRGVSSLVTARFSQKCICVSSSARRSPLDYHPAGKLHFGFRRGELPVSQVKRRELSVSAQRESRDVALLAVVRHILREGPVFIWVHSISCSLQLEPVGSLLRDRPPVCPPSIEHIGCLSSPPFPTRPFGSGSLVSPRLLLAVAV